jgi:NADH dehydrogenase [ubiquinone] 1 alpha subcomplex assembly factor 6
MASKQLASLAQSTLHRVRNGDSEMYLCGSLLPSHARASFFATRSLNLELAGVRDAVRGNVAMGRVRMAFWRDFIGAACSGASAAAQASPGAQLSSHPLFEPLRGCIAAHGHSRRSLERLVDARDADLEGRPPASVGEVSAYAEATHSTLLYLTLEALGVRDAAADHAASHVGKAAGIATLLRSLPVHTRLGQQYLPLDLLAKVRGSACESAAPWRHGCRPLRSRLHTAPTPPTPRTTHTHHLGALCSTG